MRVAILIVLLTLAGCIGSPTPHNPMERIRPLNESWWRASTAGVAKKDNPFEAFVPKAKAVKPSWPAPVTFPEDWKARKQLNLDEKQKLRNLELQLENLKLKKALKEALRPKVEKSGLNPLEELRRKEREYFRRQRQLKRSI
jgi:hypothetical protein